MARTRKKRAERRPVPSTGNSKLAGYAAQTQCNAEAIEVTPQEKHRLAECCAFFKASRYRKPEPATIRKSDIDSAEAEISDVIERVKRRSTSTP